MGFLQSALTASLLLASNAAALDPIIMKVCNAIGSLETTSN